MICVLRGEGKIVGGGQVPPYDYLEPGRGADFELRNPMLPAQLEDVDCEASALGPTPSA